MKILIDTREQNPFIFAGYGVDPEPAALPAGDYALPFLLCGSRAGAEYITHGLLSKYLQEIEERYRQATKGQKNGKREAA